MILSYAHECYMQLLWYLWGRIRVLIVFDCFPCFVFDLLGEPIPIHFAIGNSLVKPGPKFFRTRESILVVRLEFAGAMPIGFYGVRRHIWVYLRQVVDEENCPDDLLGQR